MRILTLGLAAALLTTIAPTATADHTSILTASDASTNYGDDVTLNARLVEPEWCGVNPCPLNGRQVDFYVDGSFVGTDITNSGGYAHLLLTAAQAWHAGAHAIEARYERFHGGVAVASAVLTIRQEITVLDAREGYLEASLSDDDNVPLAGAAVRFTVTLPDSSEQDVCKAFTDAAGVARCVGATGAGLTPLDAVSYNARFDGTGDYVAAGDSANLL